MLSSGIQSRLNEQIQMEAFASHAYLSLATWAETRNLPNIAQYFYLASDDERSHMLQLYRYVNENGGAAALNHKMDAPKQDFKNVLEVFRYVFELEHGVTVAINELATWCLQNGEHATFFFLQAFVAEQQQSERNVGDLISMIERMGYEERNLYYLDKTFKKINLGAGAEEGPAQ
ncbi:MAG: ferritin [Saprospiraceae bacterium]|nr:ferritin [Saprospiraceae bacterium]